MRITNQMRRSQMLFDIERLQSDIYRAQTVLNTGREVDKPSDDPVRAQKALTLRGNLARRSQYTENIRHGMTKLSYAEAALTSVNDLLIDARSAAVQAANDGSTSEERAAIAHDIDTILEDLLRQANTKMDGGHIFGGFNTQESPYVASRDAETGRITLVQGRSEMMDGQITATVGEEVRVRINVNGTEVFQTGAPGDDGDLFDVLIDLRDALFDGEGEEVDAAVEQAIGRLDIGIDRTSDNLSSVGGRYDRLFKMEQRHADVDIREGEQLSQVQDADMAEWITRYELQRVALQQAMAVGTQVLNASLVNFIR